MKIAWIIGTNLSASDFEAVNTVNNSGGWNHTQLRALAKSELISELVILSITPDKNVIERETTGKVTIHHLPYNPISYRVNNTLINAIWSVIENEKPELIDIQGTETTYSAIAYLRQIKIPILITLHGIAFQCERFYTRGLPAKSLIFDRTLADYLVMKGVLEKKCLMRSRANVERKILKAVKYVRGRTNWDRACVLSINPELQYFHEELILRDAFYKRSWDIANCEQHRIFTTQANAPLKSLYSLLETVSILKKKYEDIRLIVPGHRLRTGMLKGGYDKLIAKRIKRLGLEENVIYTGNLSAEQMVNELLKARVFVLQSEMENSPNSLAEAQAIGTPCVATFTGGTPEYVKRGETGFLYNSYDPIMAAMYIDKLFCDDELCQRMSLCEIKEAQSRHNDKKITQGLINIYRSIIEGENA